MTDYRIGERGLLLIERFEGYRSVRYLDAVGVPTIGFGTTAAVIDPVPETCTLAQATEWLKTSLARTYEPAINALDVPLNPNQFDALCSLVYNEGPGAMQWQIGRDLRSHNYAAAAERFLNYDEAGGQPILLGRRELERALFLSPYIPPAPADPYRYGWFDTVPREIGGHEVTERATVEHYDSLRTHAHMHGVELNRLRGVLGALAGRVLTVSFEQPLPNGNPSYNIDHRGWRHLQLDGRAHGHQYAH